MAKRLPNYNFLQKQFRRFQFIEIQADMTFMFKEIQITCLFIIFSYEFYV